MTAGWVNWRRRLGLALVTAIAVLSFAGLRTAAGESATEATASRAQTEKIANFEYQPTPLRVSAGTRVVFSNQSSVTHTATQNGGGFDTGNIRAGKTASVTFKRPGVYVFHCSIHPFMHGKIVVK
jgi:plastocyanin